MRVFVIAGLALIALGAAFVPLPWSVIEPGTFVAAADAVDIEVDPELDEAAAVGDRTVTGEFLAVTHHERAPAARLVAAVFDADAYVVRAGAPVPAGDVPPVLTATMTGLGIVPRFAELSELPVRAEITGAVDAHSLGVALHAFDFGSQLDVAGGRRILGLGRLAGTGELVCDVVAVAESLRAAAREGVDVVVVASDCLTLVSGVLPADTPYELVDAPILPTAAEALLPPPEG